MVSCSKNIAPALPSGISVNFSEINLSARSSKYSISVASILSEPGADRGPRAGSPLGVVDATGYHAQPAREGVTAEQSLFAATLGGALSLGLENQIGALAEGMQADVTVVSLNGAHQQPVRDPAAALVFSSSTRDVALTMVAGKEVYRDGGVRGVDEDDLRGRLEQVRIKLEPGN